MENFRFEIFLRKLIGAVLLIAVLSGIFAALSYAPNAAWKGTELSGTWEYRMGDSPRDSAGNLLWLAEKWESSNWNVSTGVPDLFGKSETNAWLRTRLPQLAVHDPAVFILEGIQAFEVFLGAQKIYSFGSVLDGGKGVVAGNGNHLIPLGNDFGGKTLTFRFFSKDLNIGLVGVPLLGNRSEIVQRLQEKSWLLVGFFSFTAVLGIFSLFLSRGGTNGRLYWDMGLLSVCIGLYTMASSRIAHRVMGDSLYLIHAEQFLEILVPAFFVSYIYELWGDGKRNALFWLRRYFFVYGVSYILFIFSGILPIKSFILISWFSIVTSFFIVMLAVVSAVRAKKPFVLAFGLSTLVAGIGVVLEILAVSRVIPIGVGTFYLGALGMLFGLTYIVIKRYIESFQKLVTLSEKLEKVFEGTKEMASVHNRIDAVVAAVKWVRQEVSLSAKPSVHVWLVEDDGKFNVVSVMRDGVPLEVHSARSDPKQSAEVKKILSTVGGQDCFLDERRNLMIPIRWRDKTLGLIAIASYAKDTLAPDDSDFINTLMGALGLALENARYVSQVAEKARLEAEVQAAEFVQQNLLPDFVRVPGIKFHSEVKTASEMGGDWFGNYFDEVGARFYFFVGDVTGHGVPSALISAVACGAVYSSLNVGHAGVLGENRGTDAVLLDIARRLNDVVYRTGRRADHVMTMLLGCVDIATGNLSFVNAGHCHPFVVNPKNGAAECLLSRGSRLGVSLQTNFECRSMMLKSGDSLVVYTDGILENVGVDSKSTSLLDFRRLLEQGASEDNLAAWVMKQCSAIWGGSVSSLEDDATVVSVTWSDDNSEAPFVKHPEKPASCV